MASADVTVAVRVQVEEIVEELASDFLARTWGDPDMAKQPEEFKRGYAQGFREAALALAPRLLNQSFCKSTLRGDKT